MVEETLRKRGLKADRHAGLDLIDFPGMIPPSIKVWSEMCREASDEELLRLRGMALKSLYADAGKNQRWAIYVSVAQGTLRERGIKPDSVVEIKKTAENDTYRESIF
jgi:hypothetical protein